MWLSLFPPTSQMLNEGLFLMQLSKAMLLQGVPKKTNMDGTKVECNTAL